MRSRRPALPQKLALPLLLTLAVPFVTGCDRKKEEAPAPQPVASAAPSDPHAAPPSEPHGGPAAPGPNPAAADPQIQVTWKVPEGWKEMPPRPMRKTTYQAEGAAGPAEIGVFYFGPSDGGGVEANITRWIGQFQGISKDDAKRAKNAVGELTVHTVRIDKGTYSSGMPGALGKTQEGWGMHAAVVETPAGAYFFKMLGPAATVTEQESKFTTFLQSLKVE